MNWGASSDNGVHARSLCLKVEGICGKPDVINRSAHLVDRVQIVKVHTT